MKKEILSSILAGVFISIGCICFLKLPYIIGAIAFSIGLLSVVNYKLKLYTGTAGFINIKQRSAYLDLFLILFFNVVGCGIMAGLIKLSAAPVEITEAAQNIITKRLSMGWHTHIINGALCGLLMTLAVEFGRKNNWLPLLFAVPVFILCGFEHSIADAFYGFVAFDISYWEGCWDWIVLGNFIGCNVPRFCMVQT